LRFGTSLDIIVVMLKKWIVFAQARMIRCTGCVIFDIGKGRVAKSARLMRRQGVAAA
jgi:hypothetical protein